MKLLAKSLHGAGFDPYLYDYRSTRAPIQKLGEKLAEDIAKKYRKRSLYAVTHSMGGIILRCAPRGQINWKRIVMLAPPNQGSSVASALNGIMFEAIFGPAAVALGNSDPKTWPMPPAPFAIIAGTRRRSWANPTSWISGRIFAPDVANDGTVSVDETRLPGMAAFETIDANHTTIMHDHRVHVLAAGFLRHGYFTQTSDPLAPPDPPTSEASRPDPSPADQPPPDEAPPPAPRPR